MFNIKVEGFDELEKSINDLTEGLKPSTIRHYCELVKKDARISCGLKNDDLVLTVEQSEVDQIRLHFSLKDSEKKDCVKKVIQNVLASMPLTTRPFFEGLLQKLNSENDGNDE